MDFTSFNLKTGDTLTEQHFAQLDAYLADLYERDNQNHAFYLSLNEKAAELYERDNGNHAAILNIGAVKYGTDGKNSLIMNNIEPKYHEETGITALNEAKASCSTSIGWNNKVNENGTLGFIGGGGSNEVNAHCGFAANDGNKTLGASGATFGDYNTNKAMGGFVRGLQNWLYENANYGDVSGQYHNIYAPFADVSGQYHTVESGAVLAHVEGSKHYAYASAINCHMEGANHEAKAKLVHIQGWGNIGAMYGQDVSGRWCEEDTTNVVVVGWGTPPNATTGAPAIRKNIYTLDPYGNARFGGSITLDMNGTPVTLTASDLTKLKALIS